MSDRKVVFVAENLTGDWQGIYINGTYAVSLYRHWDCDMTKLVEELSDEVDYLNNYVREEIFEKYGSDFPPTLEELAKEFDKLGIVHNINTTA